MVGMTQFVNPSPNWKACTATCLVIPVKSAIGTMIGITAAAWPEPEEMKVLLEKAGCRRSLNDIALSDKDKELSLRLSPYVRRRLTLMRVSKMLEI